MDSTPVVAITGNVPRAADRHRRLPGGRRDRGHHPCPSPSTTTRCAGRQRHPPRRSQEAFHIASTGRPGPVLIDLPKDVQLAEFTGQLRRGARPPRLQAHPTRAIPKPDRAGAGRPAKRRSGLSSWWGAAPSTPSAGAPGTWPRRPASPSFTTLMGLGAFPGNPSP
jgi:acetolactate synthase-1/2/3 large subunit